MAFLGKKPRRFLVQTGALFRYSLKNRYRNTWAGFLWVILQPLVQFTIQGYAFAYILKIHQENYLLFLLSGLVPWIFFSSSVDMTASTFLAQSNLFKSVNLSPLSLIVSQVIDNFFNSAVAFVVIALACIPILHHTVPWTAIPVLIVSSLLLLVFTIGLSVTVATYQVFYRDLRFVITFVLQGLYFITPVFFPPNFVPVEHRWLLELNPLYHLMIPFHAAVRQSDAPLGRSLAMAAMIAIVTALLAAGIWQSRKNRMVLLV